MITHLKPFSGQPPPFFVLGSQRSGTTMLRLMLNNHPNLAIPHETGFITVYARKLDEYGDIADREVRAQLLADICRHPKVVHGRLIRDRDSILDEPVKSYAEFVNVIMRNYAVQAGKARWGDKTPFYSRDIDVLWSLYQSCKIIHLVRDPRDSIISQLNIEWMSNSVIKLASDWTWTVMLLHKAGNIIGKNYMEICYEDLVTHPESALRTICEHLGEDYDEQMLSYDRDARDVMPQISLRWHSNSVQAPQTGKIGKWREQMSIPDRNIIEEIAAEPMELFGYEREKRRHGLLTKARKFYFLNIRRW